MSRVGRGSIKAASKPGICTGNRLKENSKKGVVENENRHTRTSYAAKECSVWSWDIWMDEGVVGGVEKRKNRGKKSGFGGKNSGFVEERRNSAAKPNSPEEIRVTQREMDYRDCERVEGRKNQKKGKGQEGGASIYTEKILSSATQ
jgi:hypothetical protein